VAGSPVRGPRGSAPRSALRTRARARRGWREELGLGLAGIPPTAPPTQTPTPTPTPTLTLTLTLTLTRTLILILALALALALTLTLTLALT